MIGILRLIIVKWLVPRLSILERHLILEIIHFFEEKLERYGVRNDEIRWFVSYLAGRKQFFRVNETDSQVNAVNIGVPQGSYLGPLLFLVYINDLPKVIKNCTVAT